MKFTIALTLALQAFAYSEPSLDDVDLTGYESQEDDFQDEFDDEPTQKPEDDKQVQQPVTVSNSNNRKIPRLDRRSPKFGRSRRYYASPDEQNRLFFAISYLYWTVSEPGLHFAASKSQRTVGFNEQPVGGSNTFNVYTIGKVKKTTFDWSSGVRADIGYQLHNSQWQIFGEYSYLKTSHKNQYLVPNSIYGYLAGMSINQASSSTVNRALSEISLNYQNAKFLFGTSWNATNHLLVRLQFGPNATWLRQHWSPDFYPETVIPGPPSSNSFTYNFYQNSSWGIGLYAALSAEAHFRKGFLCAIKAGVSGMSGQQKVHDYDLYLNSSGSPATNFDVRQPKKDYDFMGQGMLQGSLAYSHAYEKIAYRLEAAYEFNALWYMLDLYRPGSTAANLGQQTNPLYQSSAVYMQGLVLKLGCGF